jgi:hypothetical protein
MSSHCGQRSLRQTIFVAYDTLQVETLRIHRQAVALGFAGSRSALHVEQPRVKFSKEEHVQ